ncbi:MAG: HEAT repeat domain-containing protein [Anaerolineae bacterium]|nr:HEAT repeat domain-containing protein [Anaerolineae bacterium]
MRLIITIVVLGLLVVASWLTFTDPASSATRVIQVAAGLGVVVVLAFSTRRLWSGRRSRPPRSQVAEIERLYFRAMREMLTDYPNYAQVVNDLQRILAIDPRYKNARHYLQRATLLQQSHEAASAGAGHNLQGDFDRLQEQLIDMDPAVRKAVVMELIQYGETAVDSLIALLMDEDADVRVHAATALGWIGGRDAVQPLMVALIDSDIQVRRYAARAMCWVVDDNAVGGLINALNDEDSYVRCYAARALGWSQDTRAIEPLTELLNDDNADVREYATTALLDLGQQVSVA